jgi:hypothetical protein
MGDYWLTFLVGLAFLGLLWLWTRTVKWDRRRSNEWEEGLAIALGGMGAGLIMLSLRGA